MSIDEVYKILYCQDGTCNRSYSVINILESVIMSHTKTFNGTPCYPKNIGSHSSGRINNINRWNIYLPSSIHIVYTVERPTNSGVSIESAQLICQVSEFEAKYKEFYREKKLDELGI